MTPLDPSIGLLRATTRRNVITPAQENVTKKRKGLQLRSSVYTQKKINETHCKRHIGEENERLFKRLSGTVSYNPKFKFRVDVIKVKGRSRRHRHIRKDILIQLLERRRQL